MDLRILGSLATNGQTVCFAGWWAGLGQAAGGSQSVPGQFPASPVSTASNFFLFGTAEPTCLRPDDRCKDWVWNCGTDDQTLGARRKGCRS